MITENSKIILMAIPALIMNKIFGLKAPHGKTLDLLCTQNPPDSLFASERPSRSKCKIIATQT